jgi:uncharacterized protein (DUF1697 family)
MNRVALLRGVNNVGSRRVSMADLRALFVKIGFADALTLLNSGNVVFTADRRSNAALERLVEFEIERRLKLITTCFVRNAKELNQIVAANPLPEKGKNDPSHLLVVFLKQVPSAQELAAVRAANDGRPEIVHAIGREAYVYYPKGIAESKFRLGWDGTARNWNTVLKVHALMG